MRDHRIFKTHTFRLQELLAKEVPYFHIRNELQVMRVILRGDLPSCPDSSKDWSFNYWKVWELCHSCWNRDPGLRKYMDEIISDLRLIVSTAAQGRVGF